jgi:hypothetical protein
MRDFDVNAGGRRVKALQDVSSVIDMFCARIGTQYPGDIKPIARLREALNNLATMAIFDH